MGRYLAIHRIKGLTEEQKWAYVNSCADVAKFNHLCLLAGVFGGLIVLTILLN